MEEQKLLNGEFVPVGSHPDDQVVCSDGAVCLRNEALADVRGGYHRTDEERHDANVEIVTEVIDQVGKAADEYCTENEDYPASFVHIVNEMSREWADYFKEWLRDNRGDDCDHTAFDDVMDQLVQHMCEGFDGDVEIERNGGDYSGYSGSGCCLFCYKIEENEEQIDISGHPELQDLHDVGELDDVLDDVNCDYCIGRSRRRERNEESGCYEVVGRKTYMPYPHHADHPTFEIYGNPGGGWDFVVPAERMAELLAAAIVAYCRKVDSDGQSS